MNTLSWLLLAANVSGNISVASGIMVGFSGIASFITAIFYAVAVADKYTESEVTKALKNALKYLVWVFAISLLLAVAVPSSRTIYLIAASEMGEAANVPAEMSDLYQSLKTIISEAAQEAVE